MAAQLQGLGLYNCLKCKLVCVPILRLPPANDYFTLFLVLVSAQLQQVLLLISTYVFDMAQHMSLIIAARRAQPIFARIRPMSCSTLLTALQKQKLHSYAMVPWAALEAAT